MARSLLGQIDLLPRQRFAGLVYRLHSSAYTPLSGDGARRHGGRWNGPNTFPVIYTALEEGTAFAEVMRTAASTALPATGLVNRSIAAIRVDLSRVLNLTDPDVLSALAIKPADLLADDTTLSRDIGAAAHAAGYEAILAPSATGAGTVLAVFGANRAPTSLLELASDQTLPAQV